MLNREEREERHQIFKEAWEIQYDYSNGIITKAEFNRQLELFYINNPDMVLDEPPQRVKFSRSEFKNFIKGYFNWR